ncbi:MAG: rod-binding protein [Burkholderiales bacterium]
MIPSATAFVPPSGLAGDPKTTAQLRGRTEKDPEGALKMAAQQFESLVLDIVFKSMRKTVSEGSLFDNESTRLYTDMLDQEMSKKIASSGGLGLADMLLKQLQPLGAAQAVKKESLSPIKA